MTGDVGGGLDRLPFTDANATDRVAIHLEAG